MIAFCFQIAICILLADANASADEVTDIKQLASTLWKPNAPRCEDKLGREFPAKVKGTGTCDDRDSVLFNGLLCAASDDNAKACEAVINSQDAEPASPQRGEWWRSPRIALDPSIPRSDSFSGDQNLGVLLTVVRNRADPSYTDKLNEWAKWIDANRPCIIGGEPHCVRGLPRLCRDDTKKGCTMLQTDIAMMQTVMNRLNVPVPAGPMRDLFNATDGLVPRLLLTNAAVNDLDFPVHLVGVEIMVARSLGFDEQRPVLPNGSPCLKPADVALMIAKGITDKSALGYAEWELQCRQPANPFFAFLAGAPKAEVALKALKVCPKNQGDIPNDKIQWIWERPDGSDAYKQTMLWDCIFISDLL